MSEINDNDTKDSNSENTNWINIDGNKFQIRECILNKMTNDKITVTIDNRKFILLTKKSSKIEKTKESDVRSNERSEQEENQSFISSALPLVENRLFTHESIIQNQISYDNDYEEYMDRDISKCLEHMKKIIHLLLVGLDNTVIGDDILIHLFNEIKKKLNYDDQIFVVTTLELREKFKEFLLEKIESIIIKQIENKKSIIMGYPTLIKFDPNNRLINNTEYKIIRNELYFLTQSKKNQSCSSEYQNTNQSEMKSEEILVSEEMEKSHLAMASLKSMEVCNNEREEFTNDLFKFMQLHGETIYDLPTINDVILDIFLLYKLVIAHGGFVEVTELKLWPEIYHRMYRKNNKINLHINGYSPKIGSSFLRFYYKLYLHSYERFKESFPISSWLMPASNVYYSNIRKRIYFKQKDQLSCERSNLSNEAIKKLVQYLRSNKYPNPDLFPKSITYILQAEYNTTDQHFSTISSTNKISKTSTRHLKFQSFSKIRSNEPNIQIEEMKMEKDSSSEIILQTDNTNRKISHSANIIDLPSSSTNQIKEEPEVKITHFLCEPETALLTQTISPKVPEIEEEMKSIINEFIENYPVETISRVMPEQKLELKLENNITPKVSSDKALKRKFSNINSNFTEKEDYFTPDTSSNDEYFSIAEAWLEEQM